MYNAEVTACEDVIPKWRFTAKRAELKMGDRVTLHQSVFRVKTLPVFVLPYTWIRDKKGTQIGYFFRAPAPQTRRGAL